MVGTSTVAISVSEDVVTVYVVYDMTICKESGCSLSAHFHMACCVALPVLCLPRNGEQQSRQLSRNYLMVSIWSL